MHLRSFGLVAGTFLLSACGGENSGLAQQQASIEASSAVENDREADAVVGSNTSSSPATLKLSAAQRSDACRTAVAELNGRNKKIIKPVSDDGEVVRVKYTRPDDGTKWTNECRFDGDRIIWRTVDAFGSGSGTGRWRDGPYDEKITYKLSGNGVDVAVAY